MAKKKKKIPHSHKLFALFAILMILQFVLIYFVFRLGALVGIIVAIEAMTEIFEWTIEEWDLVSLNESCVCARGLG